MEEAGITAHLAYLEKVEAIMRERVSRMNRWGQMAQFGGDTASAMACYNTAQRGRADIGFLHLERARILRG